MKELSEKEVLAQLEEAYARATVALTLAQKLCIIMGPLNMRGFLPKQHRAKKKPSTCEGCLVPLQ